MLSDPDHAPRYDAFGADFRQVPEDVDPDTWARRGPGRVAVPGRAQERAAPAGSAGRGVEGFGGASGTEVDLEDLLERHVRRPGAGAAAGRGADSPAPTRRPSSTLTVEEAYRGGRRSMTLSGPGGTAALDVNDPARGHRRAAHPAGRPGRAGQRRRAARRPLPRRPARPAPPLPRRRPRHPRRPAAGAVGGGARRLGRRGHPGRRGEGHGAAGHVERAAAAAARPGHAEPARAARATSTPRSGSMVPPQPSRGGTPAVRGARQGVVRPSTRGAVRPVIAVSRPARARR